MSSTDELRRLLDERGVEWHHTSGSLGIPYTWWHSPTMGEVDATEGADGKLYMVLNLDLTPEQAVEATLGRGTCRNVSPKLGNDEFTCEECLARVYGSGGQWFDVNWKYHKFNYCPNCGRRVRA